MMQEPELSRKRSELVTDAIMTGNFGPANQILIHLDRPTHDASTLHSIVARANAAADSQPSFWIVRVQRGTNVGR